MIVCQRRILDVDLADDAHPDLGLFAAGDRREVLEDLGVDLFRREELVALEQLGQLLLPCVQHLLGLALVQFIGAALVVQGHQQIRIEDSVDHFEAQCRCQFQTTVLFQSGKVQGEHRHLRELFRHALPQQVDIVGRTAAAAGLGDQQGGVIDIILAAFQGFHELSHDQQGRVTGVVVDVFQTFLHHGAGGGFQQHYMIPELFQNADEQVEVNGEHIGCKNGIGLFHFRCKLCVCHMYGYLLGMLGLRCMQTCSVRNCHCGWLRVLS